MAFVVNTMPFCRALGFTVVSVTPKEAVSEGEYRPDLLQGGTLPAIRPLGAPLWRRHAERHRH